MNIKELATIVDQAAFDATAIPQLSKNYTFNEKEAYAIQTASLEKRYSRGEKFIGLKMGFTSRAKMEQMGVHDMIWGRLTDAMWIEPQGILDFNQFIHPRVEPEICFLIKKDIDQVLTLENVKDYVEGIAAAIEIIDSRYQNFKFSLEDVIADNCSSAGLVLGNWLSPKTDISHLKMVLEINHHPVQIGTSAAILDNPWESLVAATRLANQYEQKISAGDYIMAGAATPAVYLESGQYVEVKVETLGNVGFNVGE